MIILTKKSIHYANMQPQHKSNRELILSLVNYWKKKTKVNNVCLAGGCALNSLANYKIQKELGVNLSACSWRCWLCFKSSSWLLF